MDHTAREKDSISEREERERERDTDNEIETESEREKTLTILGPKMRKTAQHWRCLSNVPFYVLCQHVVFISSSVALPFTFSYHGLADLGRVTNARQLETSQSIQTTKYNVCSLCITIFV